MSCGLLGELKLCMGGHCALSPGQGWGAGHTVGWDSVRVRTGMEGCGGSASWGSRRGRDPTTLQGSSQPYTF